MKLLKIIGFFFLVYFIRRFIEMYKMMKQMQETQLRAQTQQHQGPKQPQDANVINADFKVID